MRAIHDEHRLFAGGILVGLAVAAVTLLTVGAVRRARSRHVEALREQQERQEEAHFIDGVHPPPDEVLKARPAAESGIGTLASERPDFAVNSQRW